MTMLVTVFGGTGFLGRRIVDRLTREGTTVRVAARHPERAQHVGAAAGSVRTIPVAADIRDHETVGAAVAGAAAVVNAVSAYVERGGITYAAVHTEGAATVAKACGRHNVDRLVHISGIGADPVSRAPYIRARGEGEQAVQRAFPRATILRPSVMFAPDDEFLNALARIARSTPVIPLIGGGGTKLQPIHASDVAAAVDVCLHDATACGRIYELGGPESYTLREIFDMILARIGRRRLFVPIPFALAGPLARLAEILPEAPLSLAQVDLLKHDNLPSPQMGGVAELGLTPRSLKSTLAELADGQARASG
jgi:NADH dehydrogenase